MIPIWNRIMSHIEDEKKDHVNFNGETLVFTNSLFCFILFNHDFCNIGMNLNAYKSQNITAFDTSNHKKYW